MESTLKKDTNFCPYCGAKLHEICQCWVKKYEYNCGHDKCPGYNLFALEKEERSRFHYVHENEWEKCQKNFHLSDFRSKDCVIGIEWSNKLEPISTVCEFKENGEYYAIQNAFIPNNKDIIKRYIKNTEELYNLTIKEVVYDPYDTGRLAVDIEESGYTVIECRQTANALDKPMNDLIENIHNGTLHHNGDNIFNSSIRNMAIKETAEGLIIPDRAKSASNISPALALINAHSRAMYVL